MSCYSPLYGFPYGVDQITGKRQIRILKSYDPLAKHPDAIQIPCGRCTGCRLARSREWANRCVLEMQYHDTAFFVTLTYSDDHIPVSYYSDPDTGEALPSYSLRKRDFQLFMKRLRKRFPDDKIRYLACGEYGPETMRPHYHAILFGLHLHDLVPWSKSPQGFTYYRSSSLETVWSERIAPNRKGSVTPLAYSPLGNVVVAPASWESCAYTARYVLKKLNGPEAEYYDRFAIEPPFSVMSRKPGIGRQYYDDHPDLYKHQYISVATETKGLKFVPPKYFDRLLETDDPELSASIKETRRRMAVESAKIKLSNTTVSEDRMLEIAGEAKENQIKSLTRRLV